MFNKNKDSQTNKQELEYKSLSVFHTLSPQKLRGTENMTTGQGLCQGGLSLLQAIVEGLSKENYMNSNFSQGNT